MKQIYYVYLLSLLYVSCKKDRDQPAQQDTFVKIDNIIFNTTSSNDLKNHLLKIDTLNNLPYTLVGFGVFTGKSRIIKFANGGLFKGVPVIEFSGWDDFGYTYLSKDTSGNIMELYRKKFSSSDILYPLPITVFASKNVLPVDEWNSTSGWEQRHNTLYTTFKTKVLNINATTTSGLTGCFEFEYSSPDYIDTVFFKPAKGPVEIRSWRAHLYENNQPGYGGYR
ncbi:MAG: hypothetical protein ABIN89_09020 [Chitinophagaceae bacterium]